MYRKRYNATTHRRRLRRGLTWGVPRRGVLPIKSYTERLPLKCVAFQTSVVSVADDCCWLKRLRKKQTKWFFLVLFRLDEERNEQVESKPEEILEPEEDGSDNPDNELGAVMEFDEDELDEAQTEAEVKNITNKHHITIEELKREVLGSVRKKVFFNTFHFVYPSILGRQKTTARTACKSTWRAKAWEAAFHFSSVLIDLRSSPQFKWFSSAYLTNNPFFWLSFKVWSYSRSSWTKRLANPCLISGWTLNVTETAWNPNQRTLYENKEQDCSGNTGLPTSGVLYCAPQPRPKEFFPSKIKWRSAAPISTFTKLDWLAQENQVLLAYKG